MKRKQIVIVLIAVILAVTGYSLGMRGCRAAEEKLITCWILCKPGEGNQVNVRRTPAKSGQQVGSLEVGDWFLTDGSSANGFIRAYGIGEYGEGWVYCGFVSTEKPVEVNERYCCVARNRVACRRWIEGPQTSRPWLMNGSNVRVYYIAGDWAVTDRGYIRSEWLEVDPE